MGLGCLVSRLFRVKSVEGTQHLSLHPTPENNNKYDQSGLSCVISQQASITQCDNSVQQNLSAHTLSSPCYLPKLLSNICVSISTFMMSALGYKYSI